MFCAECVGSGWGCGCAITLSGCVQETCVYLGILFCVN